MPGRTDQREVQSWHFCQVQAAETVVLRQRGRICARMCAYPSVSDEHRRGDHQICHFRAESSIIDHY